MSSNDIPIPDDAPLTLEERECLERTVIRHRDEGIAKFVGIAFAMAAERHPDIMLGAMNSIVGAKGIEEMARKASRIASAAFAESERLRLSIESLKVSIDDLAKRIDGCYANVDEVNLKLSKAREWVNWIRTKCKAIYGFVSKAEHKK